MITQIYGLTTVDDALLCADAGADHLGIVLDEGLGTWDHVDLDRARAILAAVGTRARRVVLSLGTDRGRVLATTRATEPDVLHLARAFTFEPEALAAIRAELGGVPLMCTVPVRGPEAIDVARRYAPVADYLLLDSTDEATATTGATGLTHDWRVSARIVETVAVPVVLAGGLGPENVVAALDIVRPWGVDSETHTSRPEDRRRKDPAKVRAFVTAAKAWKAGPPAPRAR